MLRRLRTQKRIGGRHLPEAICMRWIKDLPKKEHKLAVKDWHSCMKAGFLLSKPKLSGIHVSLNPDRIEEIDQLIK